MRVRQYVSFALYSELMPAEEMARQVAMSADETDVRASRQLFPPLPVAHAWKVVCADDGLTLDERIGVIVRRIEPGALYIGRLARHLRVIEGTRGGARLQIVRYFNDDAGEEPVGWHLDNALLDFLRATGADLDVDEYG